MSPLSRFRPDSATTFFIAFSSVWPGVPLTDSVLGLTWRTRNWYSSYAKKASPAKA